MSSNRRRPINRFGKFYDEIDFSIENEMAREYVEGDLNITVVLFEIDRRETNVDDVYGETTSSDIRFKIPKELRVKIILEEPENKTYSDGMNRYLEYGKLTFHVFQEQLDELGCDINYGDYIGYVDSETNIKYFTVSNDGKIFSDNKHTRIGYKGYYRSITCVPADANEFLPKF
jgi:hypothetical protein